MEHEVTWQQVSFMIDGGGALKKLINNVSEWNLVYNEIQKIRIMDDGDLQMPPW